MTLLLLAFLSLDPLPVSDAPTQAIAVDLNKDGHLDLAVLCEHGLRTILRDGKAWRTVTELNLPGAPVSITAADFDRDGKLDLAVADHDTFGVQLLRGDGQGNLVKHAMLRAKTTGTPHIHGLQGGDFNRDGAPDILFVSSGEGELIVLINDGHGAFTPGKAFKTARFAWHPAVGDVNGDGFPDAVSADFDGNTIAVALGDGKGGFTRGTIAQVFARPFYPKLADLNGDGHLDIFSVHDDHGRFTLLQGDGKGGFTQIAGSPIDIGREAYGLAALDANADGKLDLVATAGDELVVFQQTGKLQFAKSAKGINGVGGYHVSLADLDADGKPELIIPDAKEKRVEFFQLRQ